MNAADTNKHKQPDANVVTIVINKVGMDKPRTWLVAGFHDFRQATAVSLAYGMFWVGLSIAVTAGAFVLGLWHWLLPLVAGFMFLGPLVAVGSYGISRKLEAGKVPNLGDAFGAWTSHTGQLAMMGVMMMIFFLAWIRLATLLFALFFGLEAPDPATVYASLLTTVDGLGMLAVGTAIGAVLAFGAFSISVVAIPTLMDQDLTFMEGIEASIRSVANNFRPMLLWAVILTGCVLVGVMTFYIGLAVILPVLGHASWHAYEDLVRIEGGSSSS
ncbi:membrane protein [Litchfieldella anticariensis FP35 = DSM 16096]|uniref:Membrane protein n=1 Tax=Litchfieldella anticariensis (strain DSM 16096 / CECT 5854 / CIP 108499 / LMG 22089 / FP35) TaxID=1121939 RepID=S2KGK0_LITA3|nr:DUF2189 domain-containing protein [Halomonas anticariensis]EPC01060.1 membrane protein [Halomonas anticariensis FP35 = DSM 16096]